MIFLCYVLKMWKKIDAHWFQVPSIAKDMFDLIIVFLGYDKLSQSTSMLTFSSEFGANWKTNFFPRLMSFSDYWPFVYSVFCQVFATMRSIFLASHLLVHASFTLEIIKILTGWHKYVEREGKYFRMVCFVFKITLSCGIILWPVQ